MRESDIENIVPFAIDNSIDKYIKVDPPCNNNSKIPDHRSSRPENSSSSGIGRVMII
jgi:hypothetical protein